MGNDFLRVPVALIRGWLEHLNVFYRDSPKPGANDSRMSCQRHHVGLNDLHSNTVSILWLGLY